MFRRCCICAHNTPPVSSLAVPGSFCVEPICVLLYCMFITYCCVLIYFFVEPIAVATGTPCGHPVGAHRPPPAAAACLLHGVRSAGGVQYISAHSAEARVVGAVSGGTLRCVVGCAEANMVSTRVCFGFDFFGCCGLAFRILVACFAYVPGLLWECFRCFATLPCFFAPLRLAIHPSCVTSTCNPKKPRRVALFMMSNTNWRFCWLLRPFT